MKNIDARVSRLEDKAFEMTLQKYLHRIETAQDNWAAIEISKELTLWYEETGRKPDSALLELILKSFNSEFEEAIRRKLREMIEAGKICCPEEDCIERRI